LETPKRNLPNAKKTAIFAI